MNKLLWENAEIAAIRNKKLPLIRYASKPLRLPDNQ